jgi:hypothetical protein
VTVAPPRGCPARSRRARLDTGCCRFEIDVAPDLVVPALGIVAIARRGGLLSSVSSSPRRG